jgi:Holliday junction resolvase
VAQTAYELGRAFEQRTKKRLEVLGYFVIRASGSKGKADLVALRAGDSPLMVQCKRSGYVGPKEWNILWEEAMLAGAVPIIAEQLQPRGYRWWKIQAPKTGKGGRRQPWDAWQPVPRPIVLPTAMMRAEDTQDPLPGIRKRVWGGQPPNGLGG